MLEWYVMNNNYKRFDAHSYHSCRETDFNARVDIKLRQNHWSIKCRSRALGHSACLQGMIWTITMQGLTLTAIIAAEKQTNARVDMKLWQSHWSYQSCRETDLQSYNKVTGAWNVDQGHLVIVRAWKVHVCYEQLLCKVWPSHLS